LLILTPDWLEPKISRFLRKMLIYAALRGADGQQGQAARQAGRRAREEDDQARREYFAIDS
jgi:hypothetical protein